MTIPNGNSDPAVTSTTKVASYNWYIPTILPMSVRGFPQKPRFAMESPCRVRCEPHLFAGVKRRWAEHATTEFKKGGLTLSGHAQDAENRVPSTGADPFFKHNARRQKVIAFGKGAVMQRKRFTWGSTLTGMIMPAWAGILLVVISSLMVGHWVSLPHPEMGEQLRIQTATSSGHGSEDLGGAVYAFHFLYGDCPCSRRVLKRVVAREPVTGARERIVFIGRDPELQRDAAAKGYAVDCVDPEQLQSKYGVESAPLLILTNENGEILYSGGYTSRKQGLDVQDVELISRVVAGEPVEGLPLYGCAVSRSLKAIIDPLNLKSVEDFRAN